MPSSANHPLTRISGFLAAATTAIALAFAAVPADQASAAGGYTTSTINNCPSYAPYYKVSYTGYAVCSRYP